MRRAVKKLSVTVMVSFALITWGMGDDSDHATSSSAEEVVAPMGVKFIRGITNSATGWGEIPRQFVISAQNDGILLMLPYGIMRGTVMTCVRTVYGALETAFFFIPFDGTYDSMLKPSYVWEAETFEEDNE